MHVLIVTGIHPPDIGGPATFVPQLGRALIQRGWIVRVATASDDGHHPHDEPYDIVTIPRRWRRSRRWTRSLQTLPRLAAQADVVFVNGMALEATIANLFVRKPLVMKVVGDLAWERSVTGGLITDDFETFQRTRYSTRIEALKALRRWWSQRAQRIITPSRYLARWVSGWGIPEDRIDVVPNAAEAREVRTPPLPALPTARRLVTVGRLVPWKHVDRILRVVTRLDDTGLIVVGDGPERSRLERLARDLQLTTRVLFTGSLPRAEALGVMRSCDLVVLNSSYEGFSHVIVEALSLGIPVVATRVGGTPEVLTDSVNGRLIRPFDDRALEEAITTLLASEPERRRLAAGALATARAFSLEHMVEGIASVLSTATAGRL